MEDFRQCWEEFQTDPDSYWSKVARKLHWDKPWDTLVDMIDPKTIKWFVGGKLSLCYNCLDRNVKEGIGEKTAIIQESFYTKESRKISFKELLDEVSHLAGAMADCGVGVGDHVLIYMPMIPEAMIAILASCRIGAVYSALAQMSTLVALKERIEEMQPKIIFATNCGFDVTGTAVPMKSILDEALKVTAHVPSKCIVFQRKCAKPALLHPVRDIDWAEALGKATPHECVSVDANHPLFIISTSGSTGKPKGIVHSVGGIAVGILKDSMEGWKFNDGHNYWGMTQFAWLGGQIAVCFGPLLGKTGTVVYEGSIADPDVHDIYRILAAHDVTSSFMPSDALRCFRSKDPTGEIARKYKPFRLRTIRAAGSALDLSTFNYAQKIFNLYIVQLYGQTETLVLTTLDLSDGLLEKDCPPLSVGKPAPGCRVKVLRDDGRTEADVGEVGNIVLKLPPPPGVMLGIFKDETMFANSYLTRCPGYYDTKDQGSFDSKGHLYIASRSDTVFKIEGTRYSCDGIEKVMLCHPQISECCVVLRVEEKEMGKTYQPYGFYIIGKDLKSISTLSKEAKELVVDQYGPDLLCLQMYAVKQLPRTHSGKPSRTVIQSIVNGNYDPKENEHSTTDGIADIYAAIKGHS